MSSTSHLFTNGNIFDGEKFLPPSTQVVVSDGVFAAVGDNLSEQEEYASAVVHDLGGSTLLPGLFDCHVHLLGSHIGGLNAFTQPFSSPFYDSITNARTTVELGFTTVRDAGGADKGLQQAIDSGAFLGPRVQLAITMMSQTGGHGDMHLDSGAELPFLLEHPGRPSGIADGVDEARTVARRILRAGANHIKIASTGGVLSPTDDPHWSQFTVDEIKAIVYEAEAQDKYVMAHAIGRQGILNALHGGVRSIEHGIFLDEDCLEYMVDHDVFLVPTLVAPRAVIKDAEAGLPVRPETLEKAKRVSDVHLASCQKAIEADIPIAFGTDSGVSAHGENLEEFELLAEAGMNLESALASATSVAARLMKFADRLGSIKPGYIADLVVLDEELTSVTQFAGLSNHISEVWKDGIPVKTSSGRTTGMPSQELSATSL